jgi:hypothetical protein
MVCASQKTNIVNAMTKMNVTILGLSRLGLCPLAGFGSAFIRDLRERLKDRTAAGLRRALAFPRGPAPQEYREKTDPGYNNLSPLPDS